MNIITHQGGNPINTWVSSSFLWKLNFTTVHYMSRFPGRYFYQELCNADFSHNSAQPPGGRPAFWGLNDAGRFVTERTADRPDSSGINIKHQ